MVRSWTDEQKAAIYAPVGKYNILVSADAGSGKTAVLVERICNMIINDGVSIENLLVVTFTNAAAAGMKEKIIKRLQQCVAECNNSMEKRRLKEQTYLCATADILTIDAFCLNVLKNNFHFAGIAPNFYIMDKTEEEIIK
ncbi:MAG: UvrD-helicase domain-containing protein, partial [Clostridia bacterium]|nr:UvrD-helicase domain-containing protein [Clostridia bacterium]